MMEMGKVWLLVATLGCGSITARRSRMLAVPLIVRTCLSHTAAGIGAVVVTILSQGDNYHAARAREKREEWLEQLASVVELEEVGSVCSLNHHLSVAVNCAACPQSSLPPVLLAHELPVSGAAWTIIPLLS